MSDREKVINDQQREIEELEERLAIVLEGQLEIVRCKDCKWYSEKGFCKHPNGGAGNVRPADWFCADGKKRDNNDG